MERRLLRLCLLASLVLPIAGCSSNPTSIGDDGPVQATLAPAERIDVDALLGQYGFSRCASPVPSEDLSDERRREIYDEMVARDLGSGAGLDPGYQVQLDLYVLDEATLSALATFVAPTEACLSGGDPNNYVPLGPQALVGNGWRWIGAGSYEPPSDLGLVVDQPGYDELWQHLGEGPETSQPAVDFEHELILTIRHGSGVNFGRCGYRFDGFNVNDDIVTIQFFRPGGQSDCLTDYRPTTYAVALDRSAIPGPPFVFAIQGGPIDQPGEAQALSDAQGLPIESQEPAQGSTSTMAPTTSAPS